MYIPEEDSHKIDVEFRTFKDVSIEQLYNSECEFTIETSGGSIYTGMTVEWEQGRTRHSQYGNYFFSDGSNKVYPESVIQYCEE